MNIKGRNKISPDFNMSSMTDIVFLLLIFFMIASTLSQQLNTIKIELPQAKGKTENRKSVSVSLLSNRIIYVNDELVERKFLEQKMLKKLEKIQPPSIILRAEKSVQIDDVVYVMNIANENSIKVVLAVDAN
ncbi:MAG: biopolymer transporter ExbD [Flavobacteriaceae bacterium]|jgi:biopolymer transport protein ExbD|nr:biopolymer transporter ExbD [Flavobacteriaceae bacterium]|tara:strand:+ start:288 stop:683 length:396 start_codon:yes stop_codon:yes gene_type:complete